MSFPSAQAYFDRRQADLQQIVTLIEACRPGSPVTYFTRVFVARPDKLERCDRGDPANLQRLMAALKAADLVSADFVLGDDKQLVSVDLGIHYTGMGNAGPTTTLDYYVAPTDQPSARARALTGPPHHWFWVQDRR